MKDYYHILGVPATAPQAEIKKAYRLLAIKYHPDKNNGSAASEERFKEISESYIILGDAAKRNAYDYTRGYRKNYYGQNPASGEATPATYLILFKSIKNKVLNAGGRINQDILFKVINDILTDDTIEFLIIAGHINTNNLIIDEILVSCVFLNDALKSALHERLLKLSNGDPQFLEKLALLSAKGNYTASNKPPEKSADSPTLISILLFVVVVIVLVVVLFQIITM